ncbi:hypothetical protein PEC301937_24830 [Pectobacterium carotovorum subsp. carotovorum]|nr:hypothetical protein PEC301937_24830 [Pectobacterium carotovorum subsp. carotovorum]
MAFFAAWLHHCGAEPEDSRSLLVHLLLQRCTSMRKSRYAITTRSTGFMKGQARCGNQRPMG